ncbi:MAG: hypothetical protein ACLUNQ_00105 [Oscillospiraceae bacterium]
MKNLKKALCLLLAVLMTVSLLAACGKKNDDNADGKKVFTVGVDAEYPPFSYLGDDGKLHRLRRGGLSRPSATCWAGICRSSVSTGIRSWCSWMPRSVTASGPA